MNAIASARPDTSLDPLFSTVPPLSRHPSWSFRDVDGEVVATVSAPSRRKAFLDLLRSGADLRRLDLRRLDLRNVNLSWRDLSGCLMDNKTDLRGVRAEGARFDDARMKGVRAEGGFFRSASFQGAVVEDCFFAGSDLAFSDFRHAVVWRTDMSRTAMSSSLFSRGRLRENRFDGATMHNVDFSEARLVGCSFRSSLLTQTALSRASPQIRRFLPNRTRGAHVVNCGYDEKTALDDSMPALKADRRGRRIQDVFLWGVVTAGVVFGVDVASEAVSGLAHIVSQNAGAFVVAVGAGLLVKELISDRLKEFATDRMGGLLAAMRGAWTDMAARGRRRWDLMCLFAAPGEAHPLRLALEETRDEARRGGLMDKFRTFTGDHGQVIICDRGHLAMALSAIAGLRETGLRCREAVTIMLCDHREDAPTPCAVRVRPDGTARVVWSIPGHGHLVAEHDSGGQLDRLFGPDGTPSPPSLLPFEGFHVGDALASFERAMLDSHGLSEFGYDQDTHRIEHGGRDAIVVRNRKTGRIGNTLGRAAIVPMPEDGEPIVASNGRMRGP